MGHWLEQETESDGKERICYLTTQFTSGGTGAIVAQGQIYMGALIGVVEIHLQAKLLPLVGASPFARPLQFRS